MIKRTKFSLKRNRFVWRDDWEEQDTIEGLSDEQRMSKIMTPAMNSVNKDLEFTTETVHDFDYDRLATLDFEAEVVKAFMIKMGGNSRRHWEIIPTLSTERGNTWERREIRKRTKKSSGRGDTVVKGGRRTM